MYRTRHSQPRARSPARSSSSFVKSSLPALAPRSRFSASLWVFSVREITRSRTINCSSGASVSKSFNSLSATEVIKVDYPAVWRQARGHSPSQTRQTRPNPQTVQKNDCTILYHFVRFPPQVPLPRTRRGYQSFSSQSHPRYRPMIPVSERSSPSGVNSRSELHGNDGSSDWNAALSQADQ